MSGADDMPPVPPDIEGLLEAERSIPDVDPAMHGRVLRSVESGVDGGAAAGAGASAAAGATAAGVGTGSLASYVVVAMTAFVVGGAAGAGVYAALSTETPKNEQRAQEPDDEMGPQPPAASAPADKAMPGPGAAQVDAGLQEGTAEPSPREDEPDTAAAPAQRRADSRSSADGAAGKSTLARERRIIDAASAALVHDRPKDTLHAIARHERQFPDGQLAEERELLAVRAFVALGRTKEARERAAAFDEQFPNSLLQGAVRRAVGAEPSGWTQQTDARDAER